MEEKEMKEQIESIFGIKIDTKDKTIEEEVKEILNLGDEE